MKKFSYIQKIRGFLPLFLLWGLLFFSRQALAQLGPEYYTTTDSVFLLTHSAHKATFMSALVPGLGQIYNNKFWKVPIIYAGFTGLVYYAGYTNFVYDKYKEGYNNKLLIDEGNVEIDDEFPGASPENLRRLKDSWRRYRDLNYIGIGLLYVAQILDANVDAHLFDYDISEDLSMRLEPSVTPINNFAINQGLNKASLGVRCSIRF